jgi:hypothetical protein
LNGGTTNVNVGKWRSLKNGFLDREQHFKISLAGRISNCIEQHQLAEVTDKMVVFEARNKFVISFGVLNHPSLLKFCLLTGLSMSRLPTPSLLNFE